MEQVDNQKHFTWIPFNMELADKLLEYKDKREELKDKIMHLPKELISYLINSQKIDNLDPFSVFAIFNRGITDKNRKSLIAIIKNEFEIHADIPQDFDGIPVFDNRNSYLNEENDEIWHFFESTINKASDFPLYFDKVLKHKGIKWNITMILFWIRPNEFLPLDTKTQIYLQSEEIIKDANSEYKEALKNINKDLNFQNYKKLLEQVNEVKKVKGNKLGNNFPEISYKAYMASFYRNHIDIIIANHNLILTGAPGTGKTYMAKEIASMMNAKTGFVQFHPSYDYSDFVEGLRPKDDETGKIGFERKDGVFKEFCAKALNDPDNNYVFIIDEINRGEISKIFGELFFSIDPGYRGVQGEVKTQYANLVDSPNKFDEKLQNDEEIDPQYKKDKDDNGWFFVPENVYIIGTMNDIDRSVESMDFAMRRRFAFKEITAAESAENMQIPIETRFRMQRLNNEIAGTEGLNTSYQIGAAYFRNCKNFQDLWDMKLSGLLKEYLRGMDNDGSKFDKLEDAYFGNLNSDPQENNGNN